MTNSAQAVPAINPSELSIVAGQITTTSRHVAEHFNKRHDDVLKRIRALDCSPEFTLRNFAECSRRGSNNKPEPYFRITRDGFTFLCMGFTGKEAAKWKEAYINAFNQMEAQLRQAANDAMPGVTQIEPADEDFILLHYNRRALLVYRRGSDFWYRSAHVASLVGMRDGYSLARSLQPHDLIELKHGKHTGSMVSHRAMLAALGRLKADESKALLEWLQLVIPGAFTTPLAALPDPAFVENTEATEQLRALLAGKRFVLYSLDDAKMQIRELAPNAIITTPERLPNWIADPFGIPAKLLPDVLQAVGRRMAR